MSVRGALPGLYVDPEIQILKLKRKIVAILEILRSINKQKEDVADLIDTMEHLEPVIDRILKNFQQLKKSDLGLIISKLNDSLSEFEELALRMDKSGGIRRLITSGAIRKKLEKLNLGLSKDIEMFVEIIVQAEVKEADRDAERPPRANSNSSSTSPVVPRNRTASNNLIAPSIPNPTMEINYGSYIPPPTTLDAPPAAPNHDYGHTRQILAAHAASLAAANQANSQLSSPLSSSSIPPSNPLHSSGHTPNLPVHPPTPAQQRNGQTPSDIPTSIEEILNDINRTALKFPPLGNDERYASFAALMAAAEIQKSEWDTNINSPMADWNQLTSFMERQGITIRRSDDSDMLHYILDEQCMGAVSKTRYYEFLKGYGPADRCLTHIMEMMTWPWFYGYLSSKEAETLLHQQPAGTFLLRLARTTVDGFAFSVSQGSGRTSHMLLEGDMPNGYVLKDESGKTIIFKNLKDVTQAYAGYLQTPLLTDIPLFPWFVGEKSSDECARMFSSASAEAGTFVIRFSSQPGCFAATYLDSDKRVKNALIENLVDEHGRSSGFKIRGESPVYSSITALIDHYHSVLVRTLKREPQASYHFGRIKRVGAANYIPFPQQPEINPNLVEVQVVDQVPESLPPTSTQQPSQSSSNPIAISNAGGGMGTGYEPPVGNSPSRQMNALPSTPGSPSTSRIHGGSNPIQVTEITEQVVGGAGGGGIEAEPEEAEYMAKLGINDKKYPTRWMYLYADTLTISIHKFYLTTTWIERMSPDFANGCAFRIISPEKRIIVIASDKHEMESFLPVVQIQILFILSSRGWIIINNDPDGILEMGQENSRRRFAQYVFSSGDSYEGEWENGVFEGVGTHIKADGRKYEGNFTRGLRSGFGVLVSAGKERYEGEFMDNMRHGKGVQTYTDSNQFIRYEGQFAKDLRSGMGDLHYSNGGVLRCIWENDRPSIQDKPLCMIYPTGERYVGEVMHASASFAFGYLRNGYGIMYYINGDRYLGSWVNNIRQGSGYQITKTMECIGEWENDKMRGTGTIVVNGGGTEPDHVITGKFSMVPGMLSIRKALLKVGKIDSEERKNSMLVGNQWKPLVTLSRFSGWKRNEIVKVLDEGFSQTNVGKTDVIPHLERIFTCEFHPLGAIVKNFSMLFNLSFKRKTENGIPINPERDALDSTLAFSDIHSFVGCASSHVAASYKVLNNDEGLDLITRALFNSILPLIYDSLMELLDSENLKTNTNLNDKKEVFASHTLEAKFRVVDLQDKMDLLSTTGSQPFEGAIQQLNAILDAKTIFDKIACLERTVEEINRVLFAIFKSNFGADQLLPSICFATFCSDVPNLFTQIQFINELLSGHLQSVQSVGMQAYVITQFEIAIRFILEMNKSELLPSKTKPRARPGTGRYSVIYKPTELDFESVEQQMIVESSKAEVSGNEAPPSPKRNPSAPNGKEEEK